MKTFLTMKWETLLPAIIVTLLINGLPTFAQDDAEVEQGPTEGLSGDDLLRSSAPGPLSTIPVPRPENLERYIKDEHAAKVLGKALFWDMQVGSDNSTACATCHFNAGADVRVRNTVAPNGGDFRGANKTLGLRDFPFHKVYDRTKYLSDDTDGSNVRSDTSEIAGSQGVKKTDFVRLRGVPVEVGSEVDDETFNALNGNTMQVTGRNAPTTINAVFFDRLFWDGRANRFFNGVNPFGDTDPDARVWINNGGLSQIHILIENAAAASQAVGPPLSDVEMSFKGRSWPLIGKKILGFRPLAGQQVHPQDSLLGPYDAEDPARLGLHRDVTYAKLIREAFQDEWWNGSGLVDGEFTHMEANFSLFWGLAILMYESELVSDQTPFDAWAAGDNSALTDLEKEGLSIFLNEGKCINCHGNPEFAGALFSEIRGVASPEEDPIEFMEMAKINGADTGFFAFYDNGFYNIGVRPTAEDPGVGGGRTNGDGLFIPWSITLRNQLGIFPDESNTDVPEDGRVAVQGAFKTPTMRNIELTGPYMHNGGMKSLREVVEFYVRGGDFPNHQNRDPDVGGIPELRENPEKIKALVAFLKALTDERVRNQTAPFDHPALLIPEGSRGWGKSDFFLLHETGGDDGERLPTFIQNLRNAFPGPSDF